MYPLDGSDNGSKGGSGRMQTIDPLNLPNSFTITQARSADLGDHPRLLDGLLYVGLTVLFSAPGLGKSMLAAAVEEHLAFGRPFGPWIPEAPHRCLVVDLEGDMRLASERSLTNTPWGLLASDHGRAMPTDIEYETEWPGVSFWEKLARLEERLDASVQEGDPYKYVRVDTMRMFLGSKPHGVNAYEWDAICLGELNRLALRFGVALVVIHHTNKAGEVSGSTGVAGSAVAVAQIKRNPDNEDECLLASEKVRVDAPFRYALAMDDRGRWEFTEDITPTQAQMTGTKRAVVDVLVSRGPRLLADLRAHLADIKPNTIKAALRRLSNEGIVVYRRGQWELSQVTLAEHPRCSFCGNPMAAYMPGQTAHPTCTPDPSVDQSVQTWLGTPTIPGPTAPADQEPAGEHPEEVEADHPEVHRFPAFAELRQSIAASRMKPLPCVPKIERDGLPWSLISERMDGAHQSRAWSGDVPEGTELVVVLDRNASFPSAMSSVPLAPNKITRTGPLGAVPLARRDRAGIFQIVVPEWPGPNTPEALRSLATGVPHPLGRLAGGTEPVWVTSSHLELLDRLAKEGLLQVVDVLDSWTGRRNTSLFERFYKWARMLREETASKDEETKAAAKRAISTAIRSLWPKQARSPFWRPDWNISIRAEASVRHWATGWRAVQGGAVMLGMGATDEVAFAVPTDADAPRLWVPTPYRIGYGYGQVKHKEIKVGSKESQETHLSPVTVDQWRARGHRGR